MIDKRTIEHMAYLARLEIDEARADEFAEQVSKILGYFVEISKVETKGVEPLTTPAEIEPFWREDKASKPNSVEEIVANAPDKVGNLFKVPPVV